MYLINFKLKENGYGCDYWAMATARVKVTNEEADLIRKDDDWTIYKALETGLMKPSHYSGPGRSYIHEPGWRLHRNNVVSMSQDFGYDV